MRHSHAGIPKHVTYFCVINILKPSFFDIIYLVLLLLWWWWWWLLLLLLFSLWWMKLEMTQSGTRVCWFCLFFCLFVCLFFVRCEDSKGFVRGCFNAMCQTVLSVGRHVYLYVSPLFVCVPVYACICRFEPPCVVSTWLMLTAGGLSDHDKRYCHALHPHTHAHTHIYIYTYIYMCIYIIAYKDTYRYTYTRIYTHITCPQKLLSTRSKAFAYCDSQSS